MNQHPTEAETLTDPGGCQEIAVAQLATVAYFDCMMGQIALVNRAEAIKGFNLDTFRNEAQSLQQSGMHWRKILDTLTATLDRAESLHAHV